ncbi:WD repeat-containing protein [Cryptosporidium felis]|nr:WD repeat-containing protein [Cryptosporidium felis]
MEESERCNSSSGTSLKRDILVVGGTYEGGIIGLSLGPGSNGGKKGAKDPGDSSQNAVGLFEIVFAFKDHLGSIKDMDSAENLLVTASTDETMRIYNLKTRCDRGVLTKHRGSVTCVRLSGNCKYLISCGEDKLVCLWKCANWDPVLSLENLHDSTPISADFHPSMRIALTLDVEGNICMINLLEGSVAARFRAPGKRKDSSGLNRNFTLFTLIKFNKSGTYYAVLSQKEIIFSSIMDDEWYLSFTSENLGLGPIQLTSFCWVTDQLSLIGLSNGELKMLFVSKDILKVLNIGTDLAGTSPEKVENPHSGNRIKGIQILQHHTVEDKNSFEVLGILVACDSSGVFSLFNFKANINPNTLDYSWTSKTLGFFNSENRITCFTIHNEESIQGSNANSTGEPSFSLSPSSSKEKVQNKGSKKKVIKKKKAKS